MHARKLKCSTSLWSANLANLSESIRESEPYSERFHLDVADGHYVKSLLFFPDLVAALRPLTQLPFEIHTMVTDPMGWVDPFIEAGADGMIFCLDSTPDPKSVLRAIRSNGKYAGVSLLVHEPITLVDDLWEELDILCICGTAMGIKGASMDPIIPGKIQQAREIIDKRGLRVEVEADGGIRRETVPLLKKAGADFIVPGSLMFKENKATMRQWLDAL